MFARRRLFSSSWPELDKARPAAIVVAIAAAAFGGGLVLAQRPPLGQPAQAPTAAAVTPQPVATSPAQRPASPPAQARPPAERAAETQPLPPLPYSPYPPPRPYEVVRAAYEFAARHPDVLKYVPCYCGCEASGHRANHDCFIASRDARGRITWDTHGLT